MQSGRPHTYIDVHILQTVPPSNLNRDDQGNPKEAQYGGVRRSRVSSQAWKRATRMHFVDHLPPNLLGTRTRRLQSALAAVLGGTDGKAANRVAGAAVEALNVGRGKKEGDTAYLLFYGRLQLEALAADLRPILAEAGELADKQLADRVADLDLAKVFRTGHPLDVALFGRMVAHLPSLRVDAAVQVAHALSTHAVELEFDYFTAVDDEARQNQETGAGMIGTIGFNSATLYRYTTIGLHQLRENLADDEATTNGVRHFVSSFARSVPSGYSNSFAHRTLPSLVAVVVRDDQPVNLVSAFETPVRGEGIAAASARRLAEEHSLAVNTWGDQPRFTGVCHSFADGRAADGLREAFGDPRSFPQLLDALGGQVTAALTRTAGL